MARKALGVTALGLTLGLVLIWLRGSAGPFSVEMGPRSLPGATVIAFDPQDGGLDPVGPEFRVELAGWDTDQPGEAELVILAIEDRRPPVGTSWTLTREGTGTVVGLTVEGELDRFELSAGTWFVRSTDPSWEASTDRILLIERQPGLLWVGRTGHLELRVLDGLSRPVEGAEILLLGTDSDRTPWCVSVGLPLVRSDSQGRASIPLVSAGLGWVSVHAPGFRPQRRAVVGGGSLVVHLERALPGGRELRILDGFTGALLGGSRLRAGPHTLRFDAEGRGVLLVPEDHEEHEPLRVEREGYVPFEVEAGVLRSMAQVALHPRGSLELELLGPDGLPVPGAMAWVTPLRGPGEEPAPTPAIQGSMGPQGTLAFDIPLGAPLEITALGPEGAGTRHEQTFVAPRTRLALALEPGPMLTIEVLDGHGRPIPGAARVDYGEGEMRSLELRGSRLRVPRPELVRTIGIRAPGKAHEHLTPIAGEAGRDGVLPLRLRDAVEVHARVVDSADEPLAGVAVHAFPVRDPWAIHRHPALQGGVPSAHPGWSRRDPPASIAWSDARGRVVLRDVPAGLLRLSPMLPEPFPPILHLARGSAVLEAQVPCEHELVLLLLGADLWEVRVRDMSSGRTLHGFEVRLEGESALPGQDRDRTATWRGWIPRDVEWVWVGAPGFVGSAARLETDAAGERILDVALEPGPDGRLKLFGDLEVVRDRTLRFRVFAPRDGGLSQIDGGTLLVGEGGEAPLNLPAGARLELELEPFVQDGVAYRFEPARHPLDWGAPIFRLVRQ